MKPLGYCIAFHVQGASRRDKFVWPKIFASPDEAGAFIGAVTRANGATGVMQHRAATKHRGKLISYTIATIMPSRRKQNAADTNTARDQE